MAVILHLPRTMLWTKASNLLHFLLSGLFYCQLDISFKVSFVSHIDVNFVFVLLHAETLVHSTLEHCEDADFTFPVHFNFREHTIYVRCRPYLKEFLERVASMFETIIFTASQSIYAEQLLNVLDPKRKLFRHRVYRESCVYVEGNYMKDLTVLGRDLTRVMIVDNSPQVCTIVSF
jgi:Dullard-like phosphatase family protein